MTPAGMARRAGITDRSRAILGCGPARVYLRIQSFPFMGGLRVVKTTGSDPSWHDQIERRVRRWIDVGVGRRWVVAVSGGGDSVALLRVLHAMAPRHGLELSVAHLDHGTRGDASRADAAFVADLAATLGLPFDLGRWSPGRPGHFEADARLARYSWLLDTAKARGASAVAVGHTSDDQAETVLHRVVRGTGLRGLRGIPARRPLGVGVLLVRPLLSTSRGDLRAYLSSLNQPFREDATNADTRRTRARIRHDLLPKLAAEYNPAVADALNRLARLASASYRAFEERLAELEQLAVAGPSDPDTVSLDREVLLGLSPLIRIEVIRLAWRRAGWPEVAMSSKRWRRLSSIVRRTLPGPIDVGSGVVAEPGPARLTLRRVVGSPDQLSPSAIPAVELPVPGSAPWRTGRVFVTLDPSAPRDESVDLDRLHPPLRLRSPMPGDRFDPLGMPDRSQPLNDFFRGRKVDHPRRALTPLVCDALGIVWVVGHRIADRVKLTECTTRAAGLSWDPGPTP
jgi:tRNA(Ile)-lysidine synthase